MEIGDRAQERDAAKLRDGRAIPNVHDRDWRSGTGWMLSISRPKRSREDGGRCKSAVGSRPAFVRFSAIGRAILNGHEDEPSRDRAFRWAAAEGSEFEARGAWNSLCNASSEVLRTKDLLQLW